MEQSSSFVRRRAFQLYLLRYEFHLDKLLQNDGEKDARAKRRRKKCGKIDIYSDEFVFSCSDKFFSEKSDCIQMSRDPHSNGETWKQEEKKFEIRAASRSHARLEDAYLGGLMDPATEEPVATKEESEDVDLSESETGSDEDVTWKPVAKKTATGKPYASSKSDCQGGPKAQKTEWSHNPHVSPATIHRHCDRGLASEKNTCCATFPGTFCMDVTPVACLCVYSICDATLQTHVHSRVCMGGTIQNSRGHHRAPQNNTASPHAM